MTKLDYICRSFKKQTHKKYESYVINAIWQKLNNEEIEFVTQQVVITKDGHKLFDMYFPQIKLAVEVNEKYHDNIEQGKVDLFRAKAIEDAIKENSTLDNSNNLIIENINITCDGKQKSLSDLNKNIDNVVNKIQNLYSQLKDKHWYFSDEDKINQIKKRGKLISGDCFGRHIYKMINLIYGKDFTYWGRSSYKRIINPTISQPPWRISYSGWINELDKNNSELYMMHESGTLDSAKDKLKKEQKLEHEIVYLFARWKDSLGNEARRFMGVYKLEGIVQRRNMYGLKWTLISKELGINK